MGITFRNVSDEMGVKSVDKLGIDKMGSYQSRGLVHSKFMTGKVLQCLNIL